MSSAYLTFFSCLAASNLQSHVTVISNKITDGLKHSTTETQSADASMRNNISLKICLTSRKIQLTSYLKKKLQSHFRNIFSLKSYFSFQISICLSRHFIFNKNFELAKMFFFTYIITIEDKTRIDIFHCDTHPYVLKLIV
jgi:hypothetical protein